MRYLTFLFALISFSSLAFQYQYPPHDGIDVKHYTYTLELNDSTDIISGKAEIIVVVKKAAAEIEFDLSEKNSAGKGMAVTTVLQDGKAVTFRHQKDRVTIATPGALQINSLHTFTIVYKGIPIDGLIIGKNMFNERGFFGDNWPTRAHHWLPCIDHPSDKAGVDFIVVAPIHYSVVANGIRVEESYLSSTQKLTHYREDADIPTKVMVIGAARFAVERSGDVDGIPVESWVYPQNKINGFNDYAVAARVLDFFHTHIGPYSYGKLANVQSKTRYGGLENASAIFYYEKSVTGTNKSEGLIAHEVAHQWFGNSASELDWNHVWLSEGFATYFHHLYIEFAHGADQRKAGMIKERTEAIEFHHKKALPVVFKIIPDDLMEILNTNSYQKGSWVLHMLRNKVGDELFWEGIRKYYATYRNGNATTDDFKHIMEEVSGADLNPFFNQWLYQPGHPVLEGSWVYDGKSKALILKVNQLQDGQIFTVPLEIGIVADGSAPREMRVVSVDKKTNEFRISLENKPLSIELDPNANLFFEGKLKN